MGAVWAPPVQISIMEPAQSSPELVSSSHQLPPCTSHELAGPVVEYIPAVQFLAEERLPGLGHKQWLASGSVHLPLPLSAIPDRKLGQDLDCPQGLVEVRQDSAQSCSGTATQLTPALTGPGTGQGPSCGSGRPFNPATCGRAVRRQKRWCAPNPRNCPYTRSIRASSVSQMPNEIRCRVRCEGRRSPQTA